MNTRVVPERSDPGEGEPLDEDGEPVSTQQLAAFASAKAHFTSPAIHPPRPEYPYPEHHLTLTLSLT